ncbi:hypothetical protein [Halovivax limisalsi]|uniref:hypothetical protein n=1 Tax=Halovivax limisalsi TaxID=1453760 RepID=UPI001FFD0E31|nr:hypothetical protein [Halovivax limisalsi]
MDASLDVQLSLMPRGDETELQLEDTLVEKGRSGVGAADQLVYRPDSRPSVSDYDYALAIDGELEHDISGTKIVESITREYDGDACLVLHYIINDPAVTVAYSHELYPACDLPE